METPALTRQQTKLQLDQLIPRLKAAHKELKKMAEEHKAKAEIYEKGQKELSDAYNRSHSISAELEKLKNDFTSKQEIVLEKGKKLEGLRAEMIYIDKLYKSSKMKEEIKRPDERRKEQQAKMDPLKKEHEVLLKEFEPLQQEVHDLHDKGEQMSVELDVLQKSFEGLKVANEENIKVLKNHESMMQAPNQEFKKLKEEVDVLHGDLEQILEPKDDYGSESITDDELERSLTRLKPKFDQKEEKKILKGHLIKGMKFGMVDKDQWVVDKNAIPKKIDQSLKKMVDEMGFAHVGNSEFCLFRRPAARQIPLMTKIFGITKIVTLQGTQEMPHEVGKWCEKNGLKHAWIKFNGANENSFNDQKHNDYLVQAFTSLFESLVIEKERVMIHDAAGTNRVCFVGYLLLRWAGLNRDKSQVCLLDIWPDVNKPFKSRGKLIYPMENHLEVADRKLGADRKEFD